MCNMYSCAGVYWSGCWFFGFFFALVLDCRLKAPVEANKSLSASSTSQQQKGCLCRKKWDLIPSQRSCPTLSGASAKSTLSDATTSESWKHKTVSAQYPADGVKCVHESPTLLVNCARTCPPHSDINRKVLLPSPTFRSLCWVMLPPPKKCILPRKPFKG